MGRVGVVGVGGVVAAGRWWEYMVLRGGGSVHDTPRIAQTVICIQWAVGNIRGGGAEAKKETAE